MSPLLWERKTVIISMVKKSAPTLKKLRNDGNGPVLRFFRVIFVKNLTKRDGLRYFVSFSFRRVRGYKPSGGVRDIP